MANSTEPMTLSVTVLTSKAMAKLAYATSIATT